MGTGPVRPTLPLISTAFFSSMPLRSSTDQGHYVALDLGRAPYPLGGDADAVVEDVARLGGFGIAAHPDSPKPSLAWTDTAAPIDGLEWLNLDSEWRKDSRERLARAALTYLFRPAAALASLIDRPVTLARWDTMAAVRPTVALAAVDAHGGVRTRTESDKGGPANSLGMPSYEASFRTATIDAVLDAPLSGDAAADSRRVLAAIRAGHVFSAIGGLAAPALLDFHVEMGLQRIEMGDLAPADVDGTLVVRSSMPRSATLVLLHNGHETEHASSGSLTHVLTGASGAYRVEVRVPVGGRELPWLVSNPVYFLDRPARPASFAPPVSTVEAAGIPPFPWRIEKDGSSTAILRATDRTAELEYRLGDSSAASPFVALATDVHSASLAGVHLRLRGDAPLRVSIQMRSATGARWGRSYYVAPEGTDVTVRLSELRPIGGAEGPAIGAAMTSLLLVVDLTNAAPGHRGRLTVLASDLL